MTIRFAEHMLLEAKNHGLVPYVRADQFGNRCALGLIENHVEDKRFEKAEMAEMVYPWIVNECVSPCNCPYINFIGSYDPEPPYEVVDIIIHLFNEHVMRQHGGGRANPEAEPWTLERLADWIDSQDPTPRHAEPEAVAEVEDLVTVDELGGEYQP